jgi:hypothetical protein
MRGANYLFVFLKKKISNKGKYVSNVRIYEKRAPQYFYENQTKKYQKWQISI